MNQIHEHTKGRYNNYPLYYFTPSFTQDGESLVFHSERDGWVQLYRLDVTSGDQVNLTNGRTYDSGWGIWCETHLRGIYNHLSALNPSTNEAYYFQDDQLRSVNIYSGNDRVLWSDPNRISIGQTAFSPDGTLFAFIHSDREEFCARLAEREALTNMGLFDWGESHNIWRNSFSCEVGLIDTSTGKYRAAAALDYHVHHVIFADNNHLLINHVKDSRGMFIMGLDGSGYRVIRAEDEKGTVCHQLVTAHGICYEVSKHVDGKACTVMGRYNLESDTFTEIALPGHGYVHTGYDPAGEFIYYDVVGRTHEIAAVDPHTSPASTESIVSIEMPKNGQRYHAHPFLSPDRTRMYFTSVIDGFSQICSVDITEYIDRFGEWSEV